MSYILDALKKSEEDRQRGEVPNLRTVQATPALKSEKRALWPYLLFLALLLNAGLLFWWLRPWSSEKQADIAPSGVERQMAQNVAKSEGDQAHSESSASIPSPDSPKGSQSRMSGNKTASPAEMQTAAVHPLVDGATTSPKEKTEISKLTEKNKSIEKTENQISPRKAVVPPQAVSKEEPVAQPSSRPKNRDENVRIAEPVTRVASTPQEPSTASSAGRSEADKRGAGKSLSPDSAKNSPARSDDSSSPAYPKELLQAILNSPAMTAPQRPPSPPTAKLSPEPLPAETAKKSSVPTLADLPLDVQLQIPKMSFSVFVYSKKPADRMVIIDGRTTREGQEVSAGLKLEEITQDGAIFSYKGRRFLQKVF